MGYALDGAYIEQRRRQERREEVSEDLHELAQSLIDRDLDYDIRRAPLQQHNKLLLQLVRIARRMFDVPVLESNEP